MTIAAHFPPEFGTRFSLSVDTEEEFAWDAALSRDQHSLQAVPALLQGQRYFEAAGVIPLYYVDAPVAADQRATDILGAANRAGKADIGAHLHPWVTPPLIEEVNRHNSYAGNLPESLERAKLRHLTDLIESTIGVRPIAYRAGRYGIGPNSYRLLVEEGYRLDSSVRSAFDYRDDGGPDFRRSDNFCSWTGPGDQLLEVPLTTIFAGLAGRIGRQIFAQTTSLTLLRAILARSGVIERIPLTPEGCPADKVCDGIDVAVDSGVRLMSMSFHSPSLQPGHTPYVRTDADLADFYRWFDAVFNHLAKRGIEPASVQQILDAAMTQKMHNACEVRPTGAIAAA